jgi:hypothetical protein
MWLSSLHGAECVGLFRYEAGCTYTYVSIHCPRSRMGFVSLHFCILFLALVWAAVKSGRDRRADDGRDHPGLGCHGEGQREFWGHGQDLRSPGLTVLACWASYDIS